VLQDPDHRRQTRTPSLSKIGSARNCWRLDAAFPDGRKLVAVVPDWARAGDFVYATAAV
jgi:hypothetical protein